VITDESRAAVELSGKVHDILRARGPTRRSKLLGPAQFGQQPPMVDQPQDTIAMGRNSLYRTMTTASLTACPASLFDAGAWARLEGEFLWGSGGPVMPLRHLPVTLLAASPSFFFFVFVREPGCQAVSTHYAAEPWAGSWQGVQ